MLLIFVVSPRGLDENASPVVIGRKDTDMERHRDLYGPSVWDRGTFSVQLFLVLRGAVTVPPFLL